MVHTWLVLISIGVVHKLTSHFLSTTQTVDTYVTYSKGVGILRIVSSAKYVHILKRNIDSPWDYLGHRTIATDNMVIRTCMITQDLKFMGFISTYPL